MTLEQIYTVGTIVAHRDTGDPGRVVESGLVGVKVEWLDRTTTIFHDAVRLDQIRIVGHLNDMTDEDEDDEDEDDDEDDD
jgi:hypothetical protein